MLDVRLYAFAVPVHKPSHPFYLRAPSRVKIALFRGYEHNHARRMTYTPSQCPSPRNSINFPAARVRPLVLVLIFESLSRRERWHADA